MLHVEDINKPEEGREISKGGELVSDWRETRTWKPMRSKLWLLLMSSLNIWSSHYSA